MRIFVAKKDFNAHTNKGPETIINGMMFLVKSVEDLPHPIGRHPALDSNPFTESDRWATSGDWKNEYDEYESNLKKV